MEMESDGETIDDEETGGEWVTEENLHKHLSHGVVLPIVPTETEVAKPAIVELVGHQEEVKEEEENPDFPAFDETKLPSLAELEARHTAVKPSTSDLDSAAAATTVISTSEPPQSATSSAP